MSKYFLELLKLSGDVIIRLGWSSFNHVEKLKKGEAKTLLIDESRLEMMEELLANKSAIGVYHPSSRETSLNTSEDTKERRIIERRLKDVFIRKIGDAIRARSAQFIDQED